MDRATLELLNAIDRDGPVIARDLDQLFELRDTVPQDELPHYIAHLEAGIAAYCGVVQIRYLLTRSVSID